MQVFCIYCSQSLVLDEEPSQEYEVIQKPCGCILEKTVLCFVIDQEEIVQFIIMPPSPLVGHIALHVSVGLELLFKHFLCD